VLTNTKAGRGQGRERGEDRGEEAGRNDGKKEGRVELVEEGRKGGREGGRNWWRRGGTVTCSRVRAGRARGTARRLPRILHRESLFNSFIVNHYLIILFLGIK